MHRRSFLAALSALVAAPTAFLQARPLGMPWLLQKKLFARVRFTNPVITFDGAPLVANRDVPTNQMYYINAERFRPQWFKEDEKH